MSLKAKKFKHYLKLNVCFLIKILAGIVVICEVLSQTLLGVISHNHQKVKKKKKNLRFNLFSIKWINLTITTKLLLLLYFNLTFRIFDAKRQAYLRFYFIISEISCRAMQVCRGIIKNENFVEKLMK